MPIRWRLWGVYVVLLCGVLGALAVVADAEVERLLVGNEIQRATLRANRAIDRALLRAPVPPSMTLPPPPPRAPPAAEGAPSGAPLERPPPDKRPIFPPGMAPPRPGPGQPPLGPPPFGMEAGPVTVDTGMPRIAVSLIGDIESPDAHVELYGIEGDLIAAGPTLADEPPWPRATAEELQRAYIGGRGRETRIDHDRVPRAVLMFFPIRDQHAQGVATVAASLELPDAARRQVRFWLAVAAAGAAALGAIVGVPLTGALLRPLTRVIGTAERVGAGDLKARVGLAQRDDELGRLGATFDRMLDQLQESAEAQRRFVADASHELRNPVTGLGGMIDIIRKIDPRDEAPFRRALNAMERDVDRMRQLIEDLLVLSRLDVGAAAERAGRRRGGHLHDLGARRSPGTQATPRRTVG